MKQTDRMLIAGGAALAMFLIFKSKGQAQPLPVPPDKLAEENVLRYTQNIWRNGVANLVEPAVIAAVMERESSGYPNALGRDGEIGLMQIKVGTAGDYCGVTDRIKLETPDINIRCGARYLRFLHERFNGNVAAMLAGYNGGAYSTRMLLDKVVASAKAKAYAREVMARVPRYRELIRVYPGISEYYGFMFPPDEWILNTHALDGIPVKLSGLGCRPYLGGLICP